MTDPIRDQELKATLHRMADDLPLPDRLQRPSTLVLMVGERKRKAGIRVAGLSLAAGLLVATTGLAVAGPGGLLARREEAVRVETTALVALSRAATETMPALQGLRLSSPVADPIVSDRFGMRQDPSGQLRSLHAGIDFSAAGGTPIMAAADGVVAAVGTYPELGNVVVINHGKLNGALLSTWYAHLGEVQVELNQPVLRGDVIAVMGVTGGSTGPHLHLEVRLDGQPTDPELWLRR